MTPFHPPTPPYVHEDVRVHHVCLVRHDVQWNRPIFRPPGLATALSQNIHSELPFTAVFPSRRPRTA